MKNKNKKTTTSCQKWLLGGVLKKSFPKNYTKSTVPVLESLSNTVKGLQSIRLATLLKRNPRTGVLEPDVHKCFLK